MLSRRLPRDAELLQATQQRRASEAEARRGAMWPADHPLGVLQDPEDVLAFDLFEGPGAGRRSWGRPALRQLVQCQTQDRTWGQDDGPLDDILEFPHVARPVIVREGRHCFGGDGVDAPTQLPRVVA